MVETIRQDEAIPASYPATPTLSTAAAALDLDMIWQRLEGYQAHRWTERAVIWIVEGCGEWRPPLTPATVTTVEVWQSEAWVAVTVSATALGGFLLPGDGPYRLTGTVGVDGAAVPAAVTEAFRRLAEYSAGKSGKPGARSESIGAGSIRLSHTRSPSWMADAIQNSGAGDLLRPYRRA